MSRVLNDIAKCLWFALIMKYTDWSKEDLNGQMIVDGHYDRFKEGSSNDDAGYGGDDQYESQ